MNLEELIKTKTYREINAYANKSKIIPGLYSTDCFDSIETLIDENRIEYTDDYFCDSNNFGYLDVLWNCGFVIPKTKQVLNNTFERSGMQEVVFLSVEDIGDECFLDSSINTIYLPRNVKSIGFNAFDGADTKNIYYEGSEEEFYNIKMDHSKINTKIVKFNTSILDVDFKYIKTIDKLPEDFTH